MDNWVNTGFDALSNVKLSDASDILNLSDPLLSKIITSKKALQILEQNFIQDGTENSENKSIIQLLMAACDGDLVTLENTLRSSSSIVNQLFPTSENGVSPLIYAICFNNFETIESLLENHNADPDVYDTLLYYTPLMWAIHFNQLQVIKLLLNHQADPYLSPQNNNINAISLVVPEKTEIYEFFKSHNLLKTETDQNDIFKPKTFTPENDFEDDLTRKLKMQTLSNTVEEEPEEDIVYDEDSEVNLFQDSALRQTPEFEYDKLLPEQYIKFNDSDIPSLLDYVFNLRSNTTYQHNTKIPASMIFQLIRYSHLKANSKELTEFLFESFSARLRTVTNTKSGAFNMALQDNILGAGDIVLLSYWLSSLQFLHFYFCKNEIYKTYPMFLQELINLSQSLIASLSFSINSRLNLLVDDCILNFTNLVDVSNVLYAKDWNLFKKNKSHPNNYDDILNTLFPPSQDELIKPSPIRYLQVLSALDYVLKIHKVHQFVQIQTFSLVFYYLNCIIFNRIISQSKYCSRSKALQIRLNISTIEDWLRIHNFKVNKPDTISIDKLVDIQLHNVLNVKPELIPDNLIFYYQSLYSVGKYHLSTTIELLQWLQCMTSLSDEESLINTINQFDSLNYYQLFKVSNKLYKYEVDEPKFKKNLNNLIKNLMNQHGENQVTKNSQHYMTQSTLLTKEVYVYLNPNHIFPTSTISLTELINSYGSGIGGVKVLRAKKYQPSLSIAIIDDIDEILSHDDDDEVEQVNKEPHEDEENEEPEHIKGDELFKQVQMPNSLLHKHWGNAESEDFESNPW
ncbi:unnamed protein product [Candida verbasci]|uniref:Dilute domain-containing protein n=1 Tax=Candida verbasci TaxID=1227364 RepID=A0A9W4TWP2_9ASCO|nr:unnamed protein product [Candida verbasci]